MKRLTRLLTKIFIIFIVILITLVMYWAINPNSVAPSWTGFGPYNEAAQGPRAKTLWDWMDLLLVPVMIAIGAWWLNRSEKETERELAQENNEEQILQRYFDRISNLIIEEGLVNAPQEDKKWDIARAYTITTMRALNSERKGILLKFLQEADLISKDSRIDLKDADLRDANLHNIDLSSTNLTGVDLRDANLRNVDLSSANLTGVDLRNANLSHVKLHNIKVDNSTLVDKKLARILKIVFEGADTQDLRRADFSNTILRNVDFRGADLRGAIFSKSSINGKLANSLWKLKPWKIVGPSKDYSYADFTGVTFINTRLEYVDFSKTIIENCIIDSKTKIDSKWYNHFGLKKYDSKSSFLRSFIKNAANKILSPEISNNPEIRALVYGMGGTGKTSIIRQMVDIAPLKEKTFQLTTSEISVYQTLVYSDHIKKQINLLFSDYAGQEPSQVISDRPENFLGASHNRLINSVFFIVDVPSVTNRNNEKNSTKNMLEIFQEHVKMNQSYLNRYMLEVVFHVVGSSNLRSVKLLINKIDIAEEWVKKDKSLLKDGQTIESLLLTLYDSVITDIQWTCNNFGVKNFSVHLVSAKTGKNLDVIKNDLLAENILE